MVIDLENLPKEPEAILDIIATLVADNKNLTVYKESLIAYNKNLTVDNEELLFQNFRLLLNNDAILTSYKNLEIKYEELRQENNKTLEELEKSRLEAENLMNQIKLLKRDLYGKKSEKLDKELDELEKHLAENIENLDYLIEEERVASERNSRGELDTEEASGDEKQKSQPKRQKLPDDLPRDDVILEVELKCPECGGEKFNKIEDDITQRLEYMPGSFIVKRYIRPRCSCVCCNKVIQARVPEAPISKGKAESGLLAHIIVQKYADHLPLYRQSKILERSGILLSRSTLTQWVGSCAKLLNPLILELRRQIFASSHIHGDDTIVPVLSPGSKKTKTGRLWCYVRDTRPHRGSEPPAACYFYSPDRKGERPLEHLKDFEGTLHADAYAGFNKLYIVGDDQKGKKDKKHKKEGEKQENENEIKKGEIKKGEIKEAGCWAHARRKFYEITVTNEKANIAFEILYQIGEIYKVEDEVRGLDPGIRLKSRMERSKILVEKLFHDMRKYLSVLPSKSLTSGAIRYALNNQAALMRFLEDGKVEIDNNIAERAIRGIAIGRKNWLFAGSNNGGDTAAAIYSLIETAKLNGVEPWAYLKKVLSVIQNYKITQIADLLPWNLRL
jgi:transposase